MDKNSQIISHSLSGKTVEQSIEEAKQRILQRGDLPRATVKRQLEIVEGLAGFELGRFLLKNKGLNGYWTDYIVNYYPAKGKLSGVDPQGRPFTEMEKMLLDNYFVPTQQRATIFRRILQEHVKDNVSFCSVPCGLMRDLLSLDFSGYKNFHLTGIDLDGQTIESAKALVPEYGLSAAAEFIRGNAWEMPFENKFTLLTSNGLNIYEPDDKKVIELYRRFFKALKFGGTLLTSVPASRDEWSREYIGDEFLKERDLFWFDIIGVKWGCARSSKTTRQQLESVGFKNIEFIYDNSRMFPAVVAKKEAQN